MKDLLSILAIGLRQSLAHPRTPVKIVRKNPGTVTGPATPWWSAICVMILGMVMWICSAKFEISGMDEVARPMVYSPMTWLFGMAYGIKKAKIAGETTENTDPQ